MDKYLYIIFLARSIYSYAQPDTEVYLFDLKVDGTKITITNPLNISNNPGYDNQPSFLPDGSGVLFAATRDGQTDIKKYTLSDNTNTWLTNTEGSEYSPTPMPDGMSFSTILLEESGRQLLWSYPLSGGDGEIVIPYVKIGYHVWHDPYRLFAFVLGDPPSFQEIRTQTREALFVASDMGRSFHKVGSQIAVVDKSEIPWRIQLFNPEENTFTHVMTTPEESEDMVWVGDSMILMGAGSRIMLFKLGSDQWLEVADLGEYTLNSVTRLTVSPAQNKLAVVAIQDK